MIQNEQGCALSFVTPESMWDKGQDIEHLNLIHRKLAKNINRTDILKCLPISWSDLCKFKARADGVLATLSSKAVLREKMLEFKQQLVSNKGLKEYFKQNPQEQEILLNDISKARRLRTDTSLFSSLDIIPPYLVPERIFSSEPEETRIGVNVNTKSQTGNVIGHVTEIPLVWVE